MKKIFFKQMLVAGLISTAMPAVLFAQDKEKKTDKKNVQEIVITRHGNTEEKTVVEINGDKIKVNGKDVADLKDIQVSINNVRDGLTMRNGKDHFAMSFNTDEFRDMMSEDNNRAMLGVVTDENEKGAELQSVTKESAADKAGLKKGDIITKIENKKIENADDVTQAVRAHKPGDKVTINYLRDGKEQKVTTELGKWKGMTRNIFSHSGPTPPNPPGAAIAPMSPDNMENFSFSMPRMQGLTSWNNNRPKLGLSVQDTDDGKGVKVLDVDDEGNAGKAGIKEDDIITQVDDKAVNSADDIAGLMKEKKDQNIMQFHITRNGKAQTLEVKVPRKIKTVDL